MNHSYIIKKIHKKFENWSSTSVFFESINTEDIKDKAIMVKYVGANTDYKFLGKDGERNNGYLRVYIWAKNPTKNYELMDELSEFALEKFEDLCFFQDMIVSSPHLNENLYLSVISFKVEAINI